MGILWLVAIIAFGILESVTAQFVSIWFAGGSLIALFAHLLGAGKVTQWIIFAFASAVLLILTRPLVKRLYKNEVSVTGTDLLIGKTAVMTKDTDSRGENGEAKVDGKIWTVKSIDNEPVSEGAVVTIDKIEGVKLIIKK